MTYFFYIRTKYLTWNFILIPFSISTEYNYYELNEIIKIIIISSTFLTVSPKSRLPARSGTIHNPNIFKMPKGKRLGKDARNLVPKTDQAPELRTLEEVDGGSGGGGISFDEEEVDGGWVGGISGVVEEVDNGSTDNDSVGTSYWTDWTFEYWAGAIFTCKKPNNWSPWWAWKNLPASASDLKWR